MIRRGVGAVRTTTDDYVNNKKIEVTSFIEQTAHHSWGKASSVRRMETLPPDWRQRQRRPRLLCSFSRVDAAKEEAHSSEPPPDPDPDSNSDSDSKPPQVAIEIGSKILDKALKDKY
ncbi:hypothetical protein ACLKA7_000360 [Drosophila subpalustris]